MLQVRSKAHRDQLPDAVSMAIDDVTGGAAAVVTVQHCGTFYADGQVTGLAEEPELLARVEGAEDGAAETTMGLQLLQTLNGVGRRSFLPPADARENRHVSE